MIEEVGSENVDVKTLADVMPKQMPVSGPPDMSEVLPEQVAGT